MVRGRVPLEEPMLIPISINRPESDLIIEGGGLGPRGSWSPQSKLFEGEVFIPLVCRTLEDEE